MPSDYELKDLPIIGYFNRQRFPQFDPSDAANWYLLDDDTGKKKVAMYPAQGRKHVRFLNLNRLIFDGESRGLFKSVNFWYNVVGDKIYRVDRFFNVTEISNGLVTTLTGNVFFTILNFTTITFACFTDGQNIYVYREDTQAFSVINNTVDSKAPPNPTYIATFGNRLVVSVANSNEFFLSAINLNGLSYLPTNSFNIGGSSVFAYEDGIIGQMGVLHNTLYIFCDFTTGIWQNTPAIFSGTGTTFPFKKNTTYSFDYGIVDPLSLDIDFDMMCWQARNRGGLNQFVMSSGAAPQALESKAVDILLQTDANLKQADPLLTTVTEGFFYSYENTIFYRVSLGRFMNFGEVDFPTDAFAIEFNFDAKKWARVIEANGERNRIQKSINFNQRHLVSVQGETTIYEMSGQFYTNELRNPDQPDDQATDAYIEYPMRYERVTPNIWQPHYLEFETDYVEIDFVWGDKTFVKFNTFNNTIFIVDEDSTPTVPDFMIHESSAPLDPIYIISEQGNFPVLSDNTYNTLFKPNITLYYSDDGGISFKSADNREFSQLGVYQWRMRWYQLGVSRNRVYKLVCVSPAPIVVLGGSMLIKRLGEIGY